MLTVYFYSFNPFSWFLLGLDQWVFVVFFLLLLFPHPPFHWTIIFIIDKKTIEEYGLACLSSGLIILPLNEPCGSMIFFWNCFHCQVMLQFLSAYCHLKINMGVKSNCWFWSGCFYFLMFWSIIIILESFEFSLLCSIYNLF